MATITSRNKRTVLLAGATANKTGDVYENPTDNRTYQANIGGSGTLAATILIEGSNTDTGPWESIGTITLSQTTTHDAFTSNAAWLYSRATLSGIGGTSPVVDVVMGSL